MKTKTLRDRVSSVFMAIGLILMVLTWCFNSFNAVVIFGSIGSAALVIWLLLSGGLE
jgi:hypothetical protein